MRFHFIEIQPEILKYPRIHFGSAMSAYLVAVWTATLALTLPVQLIQFWTENKSSLMSSFFITASGWVFTFVTALIPYITGLALAKFRMQSLMYFVVGALLTSLVIEALLLKIPVLGIDIQPPELSFIQQYLRALPLFTFSGLAAGFSCFLVLKKQTR